MAKDNKETLKDILVDSYAHGELPEEEYLKFMEAADKASPVQASAMLVLLEKSPAYLRATAGALSGEVQELHVDSSPIVKKGDWIDSRKLRIELNSSSAVLDMRCLARFAGSTIELDFALDSSSCVVKLPRGASLRDDISRSASSVHVTSRGDNGYALTVKLTGYADKSSLRIKTCGR